MDDRFNYCLDYFKPETHPKGICVGAGDGEEVLCFTEKGFECIGVTMSSRNITEARERYGATLLRGDMHFLNILPMTYDFVFASHCFEHSIFPLFAAVEWTRVLRLGGYLFIEYPDLSAPQEQRAMTLHHVANLSPAFTEHMFKKCGMTMIDFTPFGWPNAPEWTMNRFMFRRDEDMIDDIKRVLENEK
jgi:SAM-dependent methyltransferase